MAKTVIKGLSKSKGITRETYPVGFYKLAVKAAEKGLSRNNNLKYTFRTEILDYQGQAEGFEGEGKKFTVFLTVSDSQFTIDKLADFVNACGVRIQADTFDEQKCVGKEFWAQVAHQPGLDGTPRAQPVKFYSEDEYAEQGVGETAEED